MNQYQSKWTPKLESLLKERYSAEGVGVWHSDLQKEGISYDAFEHKVRRLGLKYVGDKGSEAPDKIKSLSDSFPKVTLRAKSLLYWEPKIVGDTKVRIVPLNDLHVGAEGVDYNLLDGTLKYILNTPNTFTIGLGDYIDGTVHFTHAHPSPYEATHTMTEQYATVKKMFEPLAKAGKIIGLCPGHHDGWLTDEKGFDIVAVLCSELGVPYIQDGAIIDAHIGSNRYQLYVRHGHGTATTLSGKINSLVQQTSGIMADVYMMGHVHEVAIFKSAHLINGASRKSYYVMCGTFRRWESSYAQKWGLKPSVTGVPKVKLFTGHWDIHVNA
jgi:hypothetical protein